MHRCKSLLKMSSMDDIKDLVKSASEVNMTSASCEIETSNTVLMASAEFDLLRRSKSLCNLSRDIYSDEEIATIRGRLILNRNVKSNGSLFSYFDKKQNMTLFSLALVDFMCFCSMSIMAPFYPREAAEKGLSSTMCGFVFSFYALIMFITSPIFGKILPKIGTKFLFLSGILLTGSCNVLFGFLEYVNDYTLFSVFCFLIRGLEALGAAAFSTASYVFVVHSFPKNISSVLGILETFVGLGMSVGPALGGLLYYLGGFEMPFFVLGIAMIAIVPLNVYLLPSVDDIVIGKDEDSMYKLIRVPAVSVTCVVIIITSSVWGFLDPTLEPHLRQFKLSPEQVGLIFLLFSALYGISSPFWGLLSDKFNNHWFMMVFGLLLSTFSLLLLGPCPYLPFLKNKIWLNLVALSLLGVSVALALLPTFPSLLKSAMDSGCIDSITTYSVIAGLWASMYSLGEIIGPFLGGFLLQRYGFPICSTVMAALTFLSAFLAFGLCCYKPTIGIYEDRSWDSGISDSWKTDNSESTPLLGSENEYQHRRYTTEENCRSDMEEYPEQSSRITISLTSKKAYEI